MSATALSEAVRDAWSAIPAPPAEDLALMEWGWGEEAARAFVGVAPVDVDITSHGFHAATPLLDLPPRAAAAYLGTYLLALLRGLELQSASGAFDDDPLIRAHTLTCLTLPAFWERVVPLLPVACRQVLGDVAGHLASARSMLALTDEQTELMLALASDC